MFYPAGCLGRISQISLVKDDYPGLVSDYLIEFRIPARKRDPAVSSLIHDIDQLKALLGLIESLAHVSGKPVDVICHKSPQDQ
jgi:hypothetical protein